MNKNLWRIADLAMLLLIIVNLCLILFGMVMTPNNVYVLVAYLFCRNYFCKFQRQKNIEKIRKTKQDGEGNKDV